jgi:hypothetical protein
MAKTDRFEMRTTADFLLMIDNWRRLEPGRVLTRTEAIEELCRRAIAASKITRTDSKDR